MNTHTRMVDENGLAEGADWASIQGSARFYHYGVYGALLRSQIELSLLEYPSANGLRIDVLVAAASFFSAAVDGVRLERNRLSPFEYAHLQDGSSYVRWEGLGEFLVASDGSRIACRRFDEAQGEAFQVYLLGQALSFALVKNGLEPLHATCVVINGEVVVLLGDSGFGKSSLAACFLHAGHRLLTDDLLVLRESPAGLLAYPGPPRIKLFPGMARRFLGPIGKAIPMNSRSHKLVIPLPEDKICTTPAPVRAVYAIESPRLGSEPGIRIAPLSSREAFVTLINNTFNYVIVSADRMRRQFLENTALVHNLQISTLAYPRKVSALSSVRDAILMDLARPDAKASVCES